MKGRTTRGRAGAMIGSLLLLVPLAGCWEHTIHAGAGAPQAPKVYDHWEHFWLGGLIGHPEFDLEEMCPSGNATVKVEQSFLNGFVTALTAGIYAPFTTTVRCRDGRRAEITFTEEDVRAIVADERFLTWVGMELPERLDEVERAQALLADR